MRLRQGRIGLSSGTALAALSLFNCCMFSVDSKTTYSNGNSAYITLPAAVLFSLLVLLPAMNEKNGGSGLSGLFTSAFGKALGIIASILVSVCFVLAAARPVTAFTEVLSRLVFDGVPYRRILLYIMPVIVFIAWRGFESVGRLALIFSGLVLVSVIIAVASAAPEFETYRLYPLPRIDPETVRLSFSETAFAFPPLAALLINEEGLGGKANERKTAAAAAFFSAAVIAIVQLALGLIYPHRILSGLLMPLYRINFSSLRQSYALRLDKLFIMAWLTGCVVSCAYLVYSASLLLTNSFEARDVTPAVFTVSAAVLFFVSAEFSGEYASVESVRDFFSKYGSLFAIVPTAAASAVMGIKGSGRIRT